MAKLRSGTDKCGYFCAGMNRKFSIRMCQDKSFLKLKRYVFSWYYKYILNPVLDITEAMI